MSGDFGEQVLTEQTAAAMSGELPIHGHEEIHVIRTGTLTGAENIALQVWNGSVWMDYDVDAGGGTITELTSGINQLHIKTPGIYRLNKGVTASAAGAYSYKTVY